MKIFVTSLVFFILIAIFSVKAQFKSQSIDEDTISLGGIAARVKRAANYNERKYNKYVNQLFQALSNAFEQIMGRPRHQASLGTANDLPTEIKAGGTKFKPKITNPLLTKAKEAIFKTRTLLSSTKKNKKRGRTFNEGVSYTKKVKKQPSGYRYKEGLRKKDAPGLVLFIFCYKGICY